MTGDHLDPDRMEKTLRFRFRHPERRVLKRSHVLAELDELVEFSHVEGIYKTADSNDWYLLFTSNDYTDLWGHGVYLNGKDGMEITIDRIDMKKAAIRVHWYPMHYKIGLVEQFFRRYGSSVKVSYEHQQYGDFRLKTGVIRVEMNCSEKQYASIPYHGLIHDKKVLITVMGRRPKCLKCGTIGHTRQRCPGNRPGTRSFADVAASREADVWVDNCPDTPEDDGSPDAGEDDVDEDTTEKSSMGPAQDTRARGQEEESLGPAQDKRARGQEDENKKRSRQDDDDDNEEDETTVKKTKERSVAEEHSEAEMTDTKSFISLPLNTPKTQDNPVVIETD